MLEIITDKTIIRYEPEQKKTGSISEQLWKIHFRFAPSVFGRESDPSFTNKSDSTKTAIRTISEGKKRIQNIYYFDENIEFSKSFLTVIEKTIKNSFDCFCEYIFEY